MLTNNLIVKGRFGQRIVSVLMIVKDGAPHVVDIDGFSPDQFPSFISNNAIKKMAKAFAPPVPVVKEPSIDPDFDLEDLWV